MKYEVQIHANIGNISQKILKTEIVTTLPIKLFQ